VAFVGTAQPDACIEVLWTSAYMKGQVVQCYVEVCSLCPCIGDVLRLADPVMLVQK
jgi:hypothetical protein